MSFTLKRSDNCVWLTDHRGQEPVQIHLTNTQAEKIGKALVAIGSSNELSIERELD